MKILKSSLLLVVLGLNAWMLFQLFTQFESRKELNPVAEYYALNSAKETGAANMVTSVVVTYRGLDTLGEVTILFLTAAIIGLLLRTEHSKRNQPVRESSEFLVTASKVLIPLIAMTGIYIFLNGHLTPGGGFQGGAVLASSFILMLAAFANRKVGHRLMEITESISGFSFIIIALLGVALGGGFLDNAFLPTGKFGTLLSAGAIPILYSFIGLKVGAELASIVMEMNLIQGDESEVGSGQE